MVLRVRSLDGLRGVAASAMVLHHVVLTGHFDRARTVGTGDWWLVSTPFHLIWAGAEGVIVFFVLSGFVLTSAVTDGTGYRRGYYLQRVLRLYLPVAASFLFALATAWLVTRRVLTDGSGWMKPARDASARRS